MAASDVSAVIANLVALRSKFSELVERRIKELEDERAFLESVLNRGLGGASARADKDDLAAILRDVSSTIGLL